ncbi:MAG TPA: patatin-like phospholipase family protein [Acetobacteraceae bacterium]|nr:patatin-like phospholipase family protein [Acetobacteraceae bacterium]
MSAVPRIGRPPFARVALLLQGGGALGAYQAGVYQALHEADIEPDWVAGISIGAINATLIAGNPPEARVDALRAFWQEVTSAVFDFGEAGPRDGILGELLSQSAALGTLFQGAPNFFTPRLIPPFLQPPGSAGAISYYDTAPLRATLEKFADFARLNDGAMRVSLGAVDIRSGNFVYFDSLERRLGAAHTIASGSLPPSFPPTEIDGMFYWDGGVVSNTPLQYVLDSEPHADTLAFQVDLWNARGEVPRDLAGVENRVKEIRYSSRTRLATDLAGREQALRRALLRIAAQAPELVRGDPELRALCEEHAAEGVLSIVHLIYRAARGEGFTKDFDFSRRRMEAHWSAGYRDMARTLDDPRALARPTSPGGIATFDIGTAR